MTLLVAEGAASVEDKLKTTTEVLQGTVQCSNYTCTYDTRRQLGRSDYRVVVAYVYLTVECVLLMTLLSKSNHSATKLYGSYART